MDNITVIGTGYVGLIAACCLANSGHNVIAVEKNVDKISKLLKGISPIYEENLDEILSKVIANGKLLITKDLQQALKNADIAIIAVGTPSLPDGRVDLSQINDVAASIVRYAENPLTVVMKSTVPPGTGISLNKRYFSKAKASISYVSNPEFLREGKAVWDWCNPDRIVIGCNDNEGSEKLLDLYSDLDAPKITMDITSAEMVKYASNAFLATKISFINEIANLCERVGADITSVSSTVGMDKRIGKQFLQAGLGYGGSCFPKDTKGLDYISSFNGYNFSLLKAVIEVNAQQRIIAVRKIIKALDGLVDKKIAVLGIAFKPGTDDMREAPALDIIDQLINEGAVVNAFDPMAIENAQKKICSESVNFYTDPYKACQECDAIVLTTEWAEVVNLNWRGIRSMMREHFVLLDGRNVLDKNHMINIGFNYMGIGR